MDRLRFGFTLLELLLVLAILGIMATLSWPRLLTTLKQQTLQGNVEQVRQVLDHARVRAVEEGRTLQLRFEPHGRRYVVLPQEPADQTAAASTTTTFSKAGPRVEPFRIYQLAEDCHFHVDNALLSGQTTVSERLGDPWTSQIENAMGAQDVSWSAPILYYPDGSATDGKLVVMDRSRRYIKLNVRGLTGAVYAAPQALMSEKLGETGG
ncbi:prepilin-type N-terminal cleavage/methylation domain-containing protein [Planctomicrobium piriforme]|nr:prepilin-type N-terminal cleavage/methylation domain-containing protein [Planctomicrobium piriforme]